MSTSLTTVAAAAVAALALASGAADAAQPKECCFAAGHDSWSYSSTTNTGGSLFVQETHADSVAGRAYARSTSRTPGKPDQVSEQWAVRNTKGKVTNFFFTDGNCYPSAETGKSFLLEPVCLQFDAGEPVEVMSSSVAGLAANVYSKVAENDSDGNGPGSAELTVLAEHCVPIGLTFSEVNSTAALSSMGVTYHAQVAGQASVPPLPVACVKARGIHGLASASRPAAGSVPERVARAMRLFFA